VPTLPLPDLDFWNFGEEKMDTRVTAALGAALWERREPGAIPIGCADDLGSVAHVVVE
jgi:hypothetical protein